MEISPDVYWLEGGSSNFYLCEDEEGLTLIDTGMPRRQGKVFDAIGKLGRQPSDLIRILITHADIDHAGSAAAIQAQTGATVYAGRETAALLTTGKSPRHMPWIAQLIIDVFIKYKSVDESVIQIFQDGDELPILGGLKVLATPGHTLDHHSFFSPTTGVLFAGDALNTRGDRLQSTPKPITADVDAARQSALRLLQLTPAIVACGHGKPMKNHTVDDLMVFFNKLRSN